MTKQSGGGEDKLTRQQQRALEREHGAATCQACGRRFGSRSSYLRHVESDHHIPRDHKFYDFQGIIYDVTEIQKVAEADPDQCGPYTMPITYKVMWSISGSAIDERHVVSLTAADLARPVLGVHHTSFGYMRIMDGHHRLTRLARDGNKVFSLFLVPEENVKQFFQVIRRPRSGNPNSYVELRRK